MNWYEFKIYLADVTDLNKDALHIYAAVLVQLLSAAIIRRPLASPLPWLCVLVVILGNEYYDMFGTGEPVEQWQVLGGITDMWNTMALPTGLFLIARFAPSLLVRRRQDQAPAPADGETGG